MEYHCNSHHKVLVNPQASNMDARSKTETMAYAGPHNQILLSLKACSTIWQSLFTGI